MYLNNFYSIITPLSTKIIGLDQFLIISVRQRENVKILMAIFFFFSNKLFINNSIHVKKFTQNIKNFKRKRTILNATIINLDLFVKKKCSIKL